MARPLARRSTSLGMALSGICLNSRMIAAERFTVSCSVALAFTSARDDTLRRNSNFFIGYFCFGNASLYGCVQSATARLSLARCEKPTIRIRLPAPAPARLTMTEPASDEQFMREALRQAR